MGKKVIKIGTKVRHTLWSGKDLVGAVTRIERCKCGEKYGKEIKQVDFDKRVDYAGNTECVFDLDNGHWCYGSEIKEIVEV